MRTIGHPTLLFNKFNIFPKLQCACMNIGFGEGNFLQFFGNIFYEQLQ